ncbi:Vps51/Vps67-domain-containing protein, partial [Dimargaris cristalligena]
NLNSAKFEPKRYTHSLLMDQPLASLLQQTNRLAQETRQLDGEMKTLVYENYSKFISATETIGRMKTDVDDMDAEMTKLQVKVNALS